MGLIPTMMNDEGTEGPKGTMKRISILEAFPHSRFTESTVQISPSVPVL